MKRPSFKFARLFLFSAIILSFNSFILSGSPWISFYQDTVIKQNSANPQPTYTTSRLVTPPPEIDGKLDDECWKHGTWAGDYHQWIPNEGAKPTYPTELNIQYDDKYLYVAFRAHDGEPGKIVRMSGVRDETVGDMVGLTLDSYRDYRTGFEFTITAWGQKVDLVLFNPMDWDFNWNAVWKGKVGLEDSAWVAELEIPFSQLRYSNQKDQVWGMHTWRFISRLQEESNWERQSKTGPGMLYNFGELRGISGLKKSRRLEILPFALGELKTMEEQTGNPFTENGRKWGGNMGLDAKIGISSNFTVDMTVNPDFGQVESDPSVMNLTAFETFYEEKRPFFLEGLTIFNYDFDEQTLFYSRRIGHAPSLTIDPDPLAGKFVNSPDKTTIISALKLSGTTSKGLSVGFIQSITANEFAKVSDHLGNQTRQIVEPLTSYSVARIQKGYKAGNTVIGGMLTSTNRAINDNSLGFLSKDAFTGGLDLLHHWKDKEYYLDAKLLGSYVSGSKEAIRLLQESSARYYQRPGADYLTYDSTQTSLSGFGGKLKVGKGAKGLWKYAAGLSWLTPGLELNDLGYMQQSDQINNQNEINYFVTKAVSIFHQYSVKLEQFNSWNFNGTFLGSGGHLNGTAEFVNNWTLSANVIYHSSATDPRRLRGGPDMVMPNSVMTFGQLKTSTAKNIIAGIEARYTKFGNGSGSISEFTPSLSVRPLNTLKLSVQADYLKNHDDLQYVATVNYLTEKRYILGTIDQKTLGLTFRVDLNLSPEFSIQYYGSPFFSRGTFSQFRRITNPDSKNYSDRFEVFQDSQISGTYGIDENHDSLIDYGFGNPDFNFYQFRSNLVAKWEYRLGSFIYLVWSSDRTGSSTVSDASLKDSFKQLKDVFPNNIFLIKFNYWFSL